MGIDVLNINLCLVEAEISNSYCDRNGHHGHVATTLYHLCLICVAIDSPHQGGLPHQGTNKAYVILLPEATYVSQNGLFALLMEN